MKKHDMNPIDKTFVDYWRACDYKTVSTADSAPPPHLPNIDFSSCEIPEGVSAVLTCETPYGNTKVLAEVIFPLSDSLLKIPHIQEMYKG